MRWSAPLLVPVVFVAVASPRSASALSTFVQRIPNGNAVQGVRALGHQDPSGGGPRNAFGEAFDAAGTQWTAALCQADSDGDGATNGEELGDPCCTWQRGASPSRSTSITHPGNANSFSASDLVAMRCQSAGVTQDRQGAETGAATATGPSTRDQAANADPSTTTASGGAATGSAMPGDEATPEPTPAVDVDAVTTAPPPARQEDKATPPRASVATPPAPTSSAPPLPQHNGAAVSLAVAMVCVLAVSLCVEVAKSIQ